MKKFQKLIDEGNCAVELAKRMDADGSQCQKIEQLTAALSEAVQILNRREDMICACVPLVEEAAQDNHNSESGKMAYKKLARAMRKEIEEDA